MTDMCLECGTILNDYPGSDINSILFEVKRSDPVGALPIRSLLKTTTPGDEEEIKHMAEINSTS